MAISSDKLLNRPSELHRRYGGRLAMQKAHQEKMVGGGPVSIVFTKKSIKNIELIKDNVVKIEGILKGTIAAEKKALDEKKKKESSQRREKQEEKLEAKPDMSMGSIKMPRLPRMGILDWIKNFIGKIILGYFAYRLIEHLPKIIPIVKFIGNATDFIIDVGGELLNGLATFIDAGYKAYDATRGFIKNIGGENFAQGFDKFVGAIDTALFLTTVLAGDLAAEAMFGRRDGGGGDPTRGKPRPGKGGRPKVTTSGGGGAGRPDIRNPLRQKPTITTGQGGKPGGGPKIKLPKGIKARGGLLGLVFLIPDLIDAGMLVSQGRGKDGLRTLLSAVSGVVAGMAAYSATLAGAAALGITGVGLPAAIGLAVAGLAASTAAGYAAYNLADAGLKKMGLIDKDPKTGKPYAYRSGGITRGGKSQGGVKRTLKKGKYKRVLAPKKPSETKFETKDKNVKEVSENLDKTKYFGPILSVAAKVMENQKPTQKDYENVGLGLNLLISKGIEEKQLKGGLVAAFAEGGLVDPDVLSAAETGGDISNWVTETFKNLFETKVERNLRMIKESIEKRKQKAPDAKDMGENEEGGATSGGGTADTSLNPYRRAFLDTLAYAEGTSKYPNTGYNTMFTGKQFTGYKDHPRQIQVSGRYRSDAAGRYQFLSTTWDGLGLPDFSPANQDKGALKLLAPHVLTAIDKGDFATAFHGARKTWASLPGAGHGQPEKKMKTLVEYANTRLSKYKKGEIGKPIIDEIDLKDLGDVKGYRVTRSGATIKNYSELPPHHTYQTTSDGRRVQDFTLYKGKDFVNVPVPSPVSGKVTWTGNTGNGGNWVEIQSNEGKVELGHFNKISAKVGQSVQAFKSVLGLQGYTGRISPSGPDGTHVHIQASDKVIGRYVNSLARGSAFHGENFGVVPKDGFMLRLHKGEVYKVIDRDSVDLLGFDLTKEIIDIENRSQLIAKAPSIIERLKAISGYADYEQPYAEPEYIVSVLMPISDGGDYSSGGVLMAMGGGEEDSSFNELYVGG